MRHDVVLGDLTFWPRSFCEPPLVPSPLWKLRLLQKLLKNVLHEVLVVSVSLGCHSASGEQRQIFEKSCL